MAQIVTSTEQESGLLGGHKSDKMKMKAGISPHWTRQTIAAIFDTPNESIFIARQKAVHESRSNPPLKRPLYTLSVNYNALTVLSNQPIVN